MVLAAILLSLSNLFTHLQEYSGYIAIITTFLLGISELLAAIPNTITQANSICQLLANLFKKRDLPVKGPTDVTYDAGHSN